MTSQLGSAFSAVNTAAPAIPPENGADDDADGGGQSQSVGAKGKPDEKERQGREVGDAHAHGSAEGGARHQRREQAAAEGDQCRFPHASLVVPPGGRRVSAGGCCERWRVPPRPAAT